DLRRQLLHDGLLQQARQLAVVRPGGRRVLAGEERSAHQEPQGGTEKAHREPPGCPDSPSPLGGERLGFGPVPKCKILNAKCKMTGPFCTSYFALSILHWPSRRTPGPSPPRGEGRLL